VFELYLGRRDPAATLATAQQPKERCEEAVGICPKSLIEYAAAQAELRRLGQ
jgi:hypothetical protein